jgi:hypothetical protein
MLILVFCFCILHLTSVFYSQSSDSILVLPLTWLSLVCDAVPPKLLLLPVIWARESSNKPRAIESMAYWCDTLFLDWLSIKFQHVFYISFREDQAHDITVICLIVPSCTCISSLWSPKLFSPVPSQVPCNFCPSYVSWPVHYLCLPQDHLLAITIIVCIATELPLACALIIDYHCIICHHSHAYFFSGHMDSDIRKPYLRCASHLLLIMLLWYLAALMLPLLQVHHSFSWWSAD